MFDRSLREFLGGPVHTTVMTADTGATLMVAPEGKRLLIFKVYMDSPDIQPPLVILKAQ
jgi:hypothetical protein